MYVGDPPRRRTVFDFDQNGFYAQAWEFAEHTGTHMDAPATSPRAAGSRPSWTPRSCSRRWRSSTSPIVAGNPDARVEVADLRAYERHHGRIPRHAAVFMYSGWERRVGDP
jgi:kynurenine formamidase